MQASCNMPTPTLSYNDYNYSHSTLPILNNSIVQSNSPFPITNITYNNQTIVENREPSIITNPLSYISSTLSVAYSSWLGYSLGWGLLNIPGTIIGGMLATADELLIKYNITSKHYLSSGAFYFTITNAALNMVLPAALPITLLSAISATFFSYYSDDFLNFKIRVEAPLKGFLTLNELFDPQNILSLDNFKHLAHLIYENPLEGLTAIKNDIITLWSNDFFRLFSYNLGINVAKALANGFFIQHLGEAAKGGAGALSFIIKNIHQKPDLIQAINTSSSIKIPLELLKTSGLIATKFLGADILATELQKQIATNQVSLAISTLRKQVATGLNPLKLEHDEKGKKILQHIDHDINNMVQNIVTQINSISADIIESAMAIKTLANLKALGFLTYFLPIIQIQQYFLKSTSKESRELVDKLATIDAEAISFIHEVRGHTRQIIQTNSQENFITKSEEYNGAKKAIFLQSNTINSKKQFIVEGGKTIGYPIAAIIAIAELAKLSKETLGETTTKTLEEVAATTLEEAAATTLEKAAATTLEEAAAKTLEEAAAKTLEEAAATTLEEAAAKTLEEAAANKIKEVINIYLAIDTVRNFLLGNSLFNIDNSSYYSSLEHIERLIEILKSPDPQQLQKIHAQIDQIIFSDINVSLKAIEIFKTKEFHFAHPGIYGVTGDNALEIMQMIHTNLNYDLNIHGKIILPENINSNNIMIIADDIYIPSKTTLFNAVSNITKKAILDSGYREYVNSQIEFICQSFDNHICNQDYNQELPEKISIIDAALIMLMKMLTNKPAIIILDHFFSNLGKDYGDKALDIIKEHLNNSTIFAIEGKSDAKEIGDSFIITPQGFIPFAEGEKIYQPTHKATVTPDSSCSSYNFWESLNHCTPCECPAQNQSFTSLYQLWNQALGLLPEWNVH